MLGCEIKRSFNMLGYNTEFIWICTLQNQSIFWKRLLPPKIYTGTAGSVLIQWNSELYPSMLNDQGLKLALANSQNASENQKLRVQSASLSHVFVSSKKSS